MAPPVIIELVPGRSFVPAFCPWPECPEHQRTSGRLRSAPHGSYRRQCDGRIVRRFRCGACDRTFPQQSFAFARERRRGPMSPTQKRRRARLEGLHGRPPPEAVTEAFRSLIASLPPPRGRLQLVADDHPAIHRAVSALPQVTLSAYPNPVRGPKGSPRTRAALERDAAMFPNDQLHRFLRHSEAAHRRETIAFGRSYNGLVERLALFTVWRNLVQARAERHPGDGTTATYLGLTGRPWTWQQVLAERLHPHRVQPGADVMAFYRRELAILSLPNERRHTP